MPKPLNEYSDEEIRTAIKYINGGWAIWNGNVLGQTMETALACMQTELDRRKK